MRLVNMETSTFLIGEKGLDEETLLIRAARLLCSVHIADQIQRLLIPLGPTTEDHHRPIGVTGTLHLLQCDEGAWLATRPKVSRRKVVPTQVAVVLRAVRHT
jgi:hypothetical protein